jgi:outer membrane protein OmpA-like peptidoglycan-associated protein
MKHLLFTLPLAACMVVPAAAQQSTTPADQPVPQQTQPAAEQNQLQSTSQTQTQVESPREPLQYESREGFWGKLNPFARKKYVRRQLEPVRNRVNELDELTARNANMIRDVDARAQEGIRLADAKATQADQKAVEAGSRAQQAQQTATQAQTRVQTVEQAVTSLDQYQPITTAEIRFRPGNNVLGKNAKAALDEMAEALKNERGYVVEVQGFSSGRGVAALENSQRMADAVVRYLVLNHEIPVYRIFTVGMGNAVKVAEGERPKRISGGRVEVSLLKNNVNDLLSAQSQAPAQQPQQQAPQQ